MTENLSGEVTVYRYDPSGRLIHSYVYDSTANKNLVGTRIVYDSQSRVKYNYVNYDYSTPVGIGADEYHYEYVYGDVTGNVEQIKLHSSDISGTLEYTFDGFDRLGTKKVNFTTDGSQAFYNEISYDFVNKAVGSDMLKESILVSQYKSTVKPYANAATGTTATYNYTYDNRGNITEIRNASGVVQNKYYYDDLGQLVREDNRETEASYVYEYDTAGNITAKKTYAFTIGTLGTATKTDTYTYGNANWGDLLTNYNGSAITYDIIGNPLAIGNSITLSWQGRQLQSYNDGEYEISFEYNADGIRTVKDECEIALDYTWRHEYILNGSQIVGEKVSLNMSQPENYVEQYMLVYLYDETGAPIGLKYRTPSYAEGEFDCYFFEKNLQGDIIAIYNEVGTKIGTYTYDAWGKCTATSNTSGYNFILSNNPFRYRGYYYDTETGLYYLQSRYYNPTWGRFINADSYVSTGQGLLGYNMFAYCNNNPIMHTDPTGHFPWLIIAAVVLFTPVGGTALQVATSASSYAGMAFASLFDEDIRNDMNEIGWNPFNSDEDKVLVSSKVSFYKGVPVFRTNNERSGSFAAIFLSRGYEDSAGIYHEENDPNTVRHERGHNTQLMMMGIGTYGFTVCIPSPLKLGPWADNDLYYYAPWETMADVLGGVTHRYGAPIPQQQKDNAWIYYAISMICPPATAVYWSK